MEIKLTKKNWIFSLIVILIFTSIHLFGKKTVVLRKKWQDIKGDEISLNNQFNDNKIFVLYFRAIDCNSCIIKALNIVKKQNPNTVGIIGYIHDNELNIYMHLSKTFLILKDKDYRLYQQMKLRKMSPFLMKINKKRQVVETIGYFELQNME